MKKKSFDTKSSKIFIQISNVCAFGKKFQYKKVSISKILIQIFNVYTMYVSRYFTKVLIKPSERCGDINFSVEYEYPTQTLKLKIIQVTLLIV